MPDGFWSIAKPTLTVTVSNDGTIVVKGVDEPNLTQQVIGTGDMDGWTVAQVRNVNGVSQLPSTGGVGTALTVAARAVRGRRPARPVHRAAPSVRALKGGEEGRP